MKKKQSQLSHDSFGEKLLWKEEKDLAPNKKQAHKFGKGKGKRVGIEEKSKFYRQWYFLKGLLGCIGGLMIHLVIGSLYQWGLLNPYITSYFIISGYPDLTLKDMVVIFPIMMFCIGVTMKLGLDTGARFGYTKILILNFLFCSIFVWVSSYFTNLLVFVAFYSLAFGLMAGMTFMVPMRVCNQYFPNKQTYVNGFILIGTGIGSVVFGYISISLLNPDGKDPIDGYYVDPTLQQIALRVPETTRTLAVLYLIVGLIGSLLLLPLQRFNHVQEEMEKTIISNTMIKKMKNDSGQCLNCKEAIQSPVFWVHVLIIILGSCGNLFINTNYKPYAKDKIIDDKFLTLVGFVGSIGNGVSRFFWSSLFNRVGYKICCSFILLLNVLCLGSLRFSVEARASYLGIIFIFNCCLGGLLVMAPTFSSTVFGKQIGPKVFGFFWCSFAIGNFLQYSFILGIEPIIGLDGIIYICLGMNVINILIVSMYKFKAKWNNDLKFFKFQTLPRYDIVKDENQLLIYSVVSNRGKQDEMLNAVNSGSPIYYS